MSISFLRSHSIIWHSSLLSLWLGPHPQVFLHSLFKSNISSLSWATDQTKSELWSIFLLISITFFKLTGFECDCWILFVGGGGWECPLEVFISIQCRLKVKCGWRGQISVEGTDFCPKECVPWLGSGIVHLHCRVDGEECGKICWNWSGEKLRGVDAVFQQCRQKCQQFWSSEFVLASLLWGFLWWGAPFIASCTLSQERLTRLPLK